jgi:ESF2/ABP1 family protein
MSSREKRNNFLDADDSNDEDDAGFDSEEELEKGGRSAKRRKVDDEDDDDDFSDAVSEDDDQDDADTTHKSTKNAPKGDATDAQAGPVDDDEAAESNKGNKPQPPQLVKHLAKKNLVATEKAIKKSGVVFLSRVPPYMKPAKLRNLLEPYGTLNRIFLSPEDDKAHARRVKAGGNKRRLFTEGWVEFVDRKVAKAVCELLNGHTIGGKKGGFYRDDIWSLLYLKNFKW